MTSQANDPTRGESSADNKDVIQELREAQRTNIRSEDDPFTKMVRNRIFRDFFANLDRFAALKRE
jgi:hypothetical protein